MVTEIDLLRALSGFFARRISKADLNRLAIEGLADHAQALGEAPGRLAVEISMLLAEHRDGALSAAELLEGLAALLPAPPIEVVDLGETRQGRRVATSASADNVSAQVSRSRLPRTLATA